jgi:hypothetical protein
MIAPWRKSLSNTSTGLGYTLYDLNREILTSDTIAITTKTFDNYLRIASVILDDGTCVIAYTTPGDLRIRQIAPDGTVLKEITVTPVNYVYTLKIFKESDGMFWVNWVTYAQQFNSELEPVGNIVVPKSYALHQNYPNPFNPATSIQYSIPKAEFVTLKIYDILGKEVKTLVHEYLQPGTYRVTFDALTMASGVYLYKVTAGPFTDVKRMMLVR